MTRGKDVKKDLEEVMKENLEIQKRIDELKVRQHDKSRHHAAVQL